MRALTPKKVRLNLLKAQIERFDRHSARLKAASDRLSWLRLLVFSVGTVLSVIGLFQFGSWAFGIGETLTLIVFFALVRAHRRVATLNRTLSAWAALKRTHVARMTLDWPSIPHPYTADTPADHPFALDLDIVGDYSLHRLLNTAVTRAGMSRLLDWLLNTTPNINTLRRRQMRVSELKGMRRFRDQVIIRAALAGHGDATDRLIDWLNHPLPESLLPRIIVLAVLAIGNIALMSGLIPLSSSLIAQALGVTFGLYGLISILSLGRLTDVFEEAAAVQATLRQLQIVLNYLETYHYGKNRHVREVCAPLVDAAQRPSLLLRRLNVIVSATSLQHNDLLWLILNALVPWGLFFAFLFDRARSELKTLLPGWLDVWFELEALGSLANLADLNPEYVFPDIQPASDMPSIFCARELGHPLIPDQQRVCNDVKIGALGEMLLITGSNMSGKSSLLRTIGVNLCLAYAGAPVLAATLRVPLFRLFTCIKISDSVTDGVSYFYAEVKRLKVLLDALTQSADMPLFFLIDEIFRGTNNRERLIGSRAYIRALVGHNGVGIVSTHDLELVKLADEIAHIANFHFQETVADGQMIFDYKLRPGPSPTTNALKIMKLAGLPVQEE